MKYLPFATRVAVAFTLVCGLALVARAETGVQLDPTNLLQNSFGPNTGNGFWIGPMTINSGYLDVGANAVATPSTGFSFKPRVNDTGNGMPDTLSGAPAGTLESGYAALMDAVYQGNNFGAGTWDGATGIRSLSSGTTSAAHIANIDGSIGIGYTDNSVIGGYGTWRGINLAAADTVNHDGSGLFLVAPTLYGDTDLNGAINLDDYLGVVQNFGVANVGWQGGDMFQEGSVTLNDYLTVVQGFGNTMPWGNTVAAVATPVPPPPAPAVSAAAVPEPSTLAGLLVAALTILGVRLGRRSGR